MADPNQASTQPPLTVESALLEVGVDLIPFVIDALAAALAANGAAGGFRGIGFDLASKVLTAEKANLTQIAATKLRASAPAS